MSGHARRFEEVNGLGDGEIIVEGQRIGGYRTIAGRRSWVSLGQLGGRRRGSRGIDKISDRHFSDTAPENQYVFYLYNVRWEFANIKSAWKTVMWITERYSPIYPRMESHVLNED